MDPISIQKELTHMAEWERLAEIRQFTLSVQIFQQNADELIGILRSVKSDPVATRLWALENRLILDQLLLEIARLLHNFVAASFSLVEHARRFYSRNYKNDGRFNDYDLQVKERFAEDPLCQFVQDLRNFFIHKKVPKVSSTLSFGPGQEVDNTMFLDKDDLENFEWKPRARHYLDAAPAQIDMLMVVSSYEAKVSAFYEWVFGRLEDIHAADLVAVRVKEEQLRRAVGAMARHHLETAVAISRQIRTPPEQFFLEFLDHQTWAKLCSSNPDPVKRANALMDEVEKFSPPLGLVRGEMVDAFVRFYRSRQ